MAVAVNQVAQAIEKIAPKVWAEEWDNVGLLVGDGAARVERILLALDGTLEVVQEAMDYGAQLIVAHHPILFRPLKNLRVDNAMAQIPIKLLKQDIAYYAAHTNLDQSTMSSSWALGRALGLENMEILAPLAEERDVIPLHNTGRTRGYGVLGYLPQAEDMGAFWGRLRGLLGRESDLFAGEYRLSGLRWAGEAKKPVHKIAIVNGSGGSFVPKAIAKGSDLLIAGDVDHHKILDALQAGMAVADIGHFLSEAPMLKALEDYLRADKSFKDIEIMVSKRNNVPWQY
ncbi:MAG: Nif3-like dinuclear metal center hexameric protein [Desulfitobacteriaceae bacterium]